MRVVEMEGWVKWMSNGCPMDVQWMSNGWRVGWGSRGRTCQVARGGAGGWVGWVGGWGGGVGWRGGWWGGCRPSKTLFLRAGMSGSKGQGVVP
jgi:hypothetical protein